MKANGRFSSPAFSLPHRSTRDWRDECPWRVRELAQHHRRQILMHLLALHADDRLLHFGMRVTDEEVASHVQRLCFARDVFLGAFDGRDALIAVCHLTLLPRAALPAAPGISRAEPAAEMSLSVAPGERGLGLGSALLQRALAHCRRENIAVLYVRCLCADSVMLGMVQKTGLSVHRVGSGPDAFLKVPAPGADPGTGAGH